MVLRGQKELVQWRERGVSGGGWMDDGWEVCLVWIC